MKRFIFLTFGFLGLAFYELSGGADFDPVAARNAAILARSDAVDVARLPTTQTAEVSAITNVQEEATVTRVALNLTSLSDVLDDTSEAEAEPDSSAPDTVTPTIASASTNNIDITPVSFGANRAGERVLPSIIFPGSTTQASSADVSSPQDIRRVDASAVNMRGGPGTSYGVVTRLDRNTRVEVLQDDGTGWVKLRPVAGGPEGWIADFLLTKG
ncbi:SH3 domain-containing protein [Roseobacter sp. YSTF-M11]|uniref:SH3 domain-containing protein n=1 Tax=Roseobacter insulae TaxID=2859783 RepID=A0A9X1FT70_9RHOB|nr:SH3 domain-containing protein [Roseobacter insulae]MBW4707315.1 SH3 domain-containing protein [Roseobacter insulae]